MNPDAPVFKSFLQGQTWKKTKILKMYEVLFKYIVVRNP